MDLVKKNWLSVVCGVIIIIALVGPCWPLGGMMSQLQSDVNARASIYQSLQSMAQKTRKLPIVNPDNPSQENLTTFPNPNTIQKGTEVTTQVQVESQKMMQTAVEINRRDLLVPGSLPNPPAPATFQFRDQYKHAMTYTIPYEILQSTQPPADSDVAAEKARIWEIKFKPQIVMLQGKPINEKQLKDAHETESKGLARRMVTAAAENHKIYLNPDALTMHPNIGGATSPDAEHIWWAQVQLWVQLDVARAIADANGPYKNILEAPVKHLLKLEVPPDFVAGKDDGASLGESGLPKVVTKSPTGRVSNDLYDVIHFNLKMRVNAEQIPAIIHALGRKRFITVLKADIVAIDPAIEATKGYIYGLSPIVELTLQCEILFLRDWTAPLMPQSVKTKLNVREGPYVNE